ncbi:MAG: hypothetical protein J6Y92_07360 [Lentisphaeria bacterium]|nr:hypothetical protein [Lentisphaeria bacterium]
MKHFCFLLLFAMTAVLAAAAKPAATTTAKPAETAKPAATTTAKPAATTTAKPAETAKPPAASEKTAPKPAGSVLTSIYTTNHDPEEFADRERAEDLLNRRAVLVQKIQDERKRLLQEDEAARKLYEEIMLLNRRLASLLETRKTMIELNSQLREIDDAVSKLKPAPAPETEAKDVEKSGATTGEAGKTDKADKADKAGKAKE